jgi:thiol:disulfide interchange protein
VRHDTTLAEPDAPLPIVWQRDVAHAEALARRERRALMLWFHADWSAASAEFERTVWSDAGVRRAAATVVPLAIDLTDVSAAASEERAARHRIERVPSVLIVDARGSELARFEGLVDAALVMTAIHRASR